jgi:flavodoxin
LKTAIENLDDYDTVFLGYPIWWGGLPMPIYSFLESYDFTGKTIYPFNTHGGSGVAGTDQEIRDIFPDVIVEDGFAISGETAQNDQEKTQELINEYVDQISQ